MEADTTKVVLSVDKDRGTHRIHWVHQGQHADLTLCTQTEVRTLRAVLVVALRPLTHVPVKCIETLGSSPMMFSSTCNANNII